MTYLHPSMIKVRIGALRRKQAKYNTAFEKALERAVNDNASEKEIERSNLKTKALSNKAAAIEREIEQLLKEYRLGETVEVAAARRALRAFGQPQLKIGRADELENWITSELTPFEAGDPLIQTRVTELRALVQELRDAANNWVKGQ